MKNIKRVLSVIMIVVLVTMCASVTAMASTKKITTGKVNMRKGASLSYNTVQTVPKGATVTCTDTKKDSRGVKWYYASYDGKKGWISEKYLKNAGSSAKRVVATDGSTFIRSSYSKSSRAKATLPKGESAVYEGSKKKDSRGVYWYKVTYYGTTGWVSEKYTTLK